MKTTKRIVTVALIFLFVAGAAFGADDKIISIMYFQNTTKNADFDWLSKGLTDMLITDIAGKKGVSVVERESIEKILKEQERSISDLYDQTNAVKIGKIANAREVVYGSFIIQGTLLRIDAKLVDIESAKVIKGFEASGTVDELFILQKNVSVSVLDALGVKTEAGALSSDTSSIDAAKAYYTGINLYDEGSFTEAAEAFRKATSLDPYYVKPQKSLEDSYKYLKDFRKQRYQREIRQLYEKAAEIKKRLSAEKWMTYGEFITDAYKRGLSQAEIDELTKQNPTYLVCDTRAQCVWNLQHILMEIGDKSVEYFEDTATEEKMYIEIMFITQQSRTQLAGDPFLPEILYMELFSLKHFREWEKLMAACEYLMGNYPDYRMMWAIEDFYEDALAEIAKPKKPTKK
ncbi:MAG: hypothetical protein JW904_03910 [Spirochaetales bacterium]|nr:hypothetical protein [Spirochaetales bacterium]